MDGDVSESDLSEVDEKGLGANFGDIDWPLVDEPNGKICRCRGRVPCRQRLAPPQDQQREDNRTHLIFKVSDFGSLEFAP